MGKFREAELSKCMFLLANLNDRMYVCIVTLLESYTLMGYDVTLSCVLPSLLTVTS